MKNLDELFNLVSQIKDLLANAEDGKQSTLDSNNAHVELLKNGDSLHVKVVSKEETFDDSNIKTAVTSFKSKIDELDDDIFVQACEQMDGVLDKTELDRLLDLEKYSSEEAEKVEDMIEDASEIIQNVIYDNIEKLECLYHKFD